MILQKNKKKIFKKNKKLNDFVKKIKRKYLKKLNDFVKKNKIKN